MALPDAGHEEYVFEPRMFRGIAVSDALLARLNRPHSVLPGTYGLDVWINQTFVARLDVTFKDRGDGDAAPCLTPEQFQRLGILLVQTDAQTAQPASDCLDLVEYAPGTVVHPRMDMLRLDLQVPQALLRRVPRGFVDPADLDAGVTAGFANYMGNYYYVWQPSWGHQGSAHLALQSGLNVGLWQLRHHSSANWTQHARTRWNSLRTYAQRPLLSMESQLTLGQTYTSGRFFSGINYVGAGLRSDERMLPDSQRGYAPVVRGVASGNALVSIRQNGQEIYQTTVAPGPFEISDLYPNSNSGDLDVVVQQADGTVQRYTVPFSAVPESLREGQSRYEASVGRTHETGSNSVFGDFVVQRGLSNAATAYGGLRLAQGYQAWMAGGVYTSRFGALGSDITWSRARLLGRETASGWMLRFSYSNTVVATGTTLTLANYHHSTRGYQDLVNVLGLRGAGATSWQSATWQQRNRFDVRLNQKVGSLGHIFISSAVQDYRDGRPRDVQYQLGYGTAFKNGVSVNVVLMRQHASRASAAEARAAGRRETTVTLSLSIPLGANLPALSTTMSTGTDASAQLQSAFSGTLDARQTLHYSLGASLNRNVRQSHWTANLQKRHTMGTVGLGVSHSRDARQLSANLQGAVVAHAGGVTAGPYVSETFALVEAPGATGARVMNSRGRIDANGYALLPSMTPYRYNSVMLDPGGMSSSVELIHGEQRVAPYAGAVVKVAFQTRSGQPMLIRAVQRDGTPIPFGAEVFDTSGAPIGMVGQGGHIYVRAEKAQGQLTVRWGSAASEQCVVPYRMGAQAAGNPALVRLQSVCSPLGRRG